MIGVFSMASMGMRMFSGLSVGVVGASLGIHWSLALSTGLVWALIVGLLVKNRPT